jgi:hypothetical protein
MTYLAMFHGICYQSLTNGKWRGDNACPHGGVGNFEIYTKYLQFLFEY